ncbi:hypothetical protein [Arthrobacter sp. NPDC090010]|uniref:hypothetical protein n=1 Tax=Arthrobacter sp. NPDC090010 TaxID=3363942 RepID=UPI003823C969
MENPGEDETRRRRDGSVDWKTLRFALGFPLLVAAAFALASGTLTARLPSAVAFRWEASGGVAFTDFASYRLVSALLIVVPPLPFLLLAAITTFPVLMRRIMLSIGISLSLFLCTAAAAGLAGQLDVPDAHASHVDELVLLLGTGGAVALGLLVHYVYAPAAQWDPKDDRALREELEALAYPELAAAARPVWARPRSSVLVMAALLGVFPAAFLSILSPWIGLAVLVLDLLCCILLLLRITVTRKGLGIRVGGLAPAAWVPAERIFTAEALRAKASDYGGWGPRSGPWGRSLLVTSGPAVMVRLLPVEQGEKLVFSAPSDETAERLAAALRSLNRPA